MPTSVAPGARFQPASDQSLLVHFGDRITLDSHRQVVRLLRLLQSHRELRALPVVVLSSSLVETDVQKARSLGAREYLIKPADLNAYRDMVLGLHQRWLVDTIPTVPKA